MFGRDLRHHLRRGGRADFRGSARGADGDFRTDSLFRCGLVAGIAKLDLGVSLTRLRSAAARAVGRGIVTAAPWLMRLLSVAGITAMFLADGGIVLHGIPPLHHVLEETPPHNLPGPDHLSLMAATGVFSFAAGCIKLAFVQTDRAVLGRTG